MGGTRRSRTAQGVAAERAVLTDLGVLDDPYARRMLGPATAAFYRFARRRYGWLPTIPVTLAGLAARVLWFDARVVAAMDAGIAQVVVVGAGYDSRAWRMRRDGVAFYELDHALSQHDKVQRAPGPGPTYVEGDLRDCSAATVLREAGLDATRPALFVLEGVTMYLTDDVVRRQLTELGATSAGGSRLAVDFLPRPAAGTASDQRQMRAMRLARIGSGEGFRLLVDRAEAVALVEACGWQVDEATGMRDAARALVPAVSGLPIDAVSEHKTLVAASRP